MQLHPLRSEHDQFAIREVHDFLRVPRERPGIAGEKILSLPHADHQRAAQPRGDQDVGDVSEQNRQTVRSFELLDGRFDRLNRRV